MNQETVAMSLKASEANALRCVAETRGLSVASILYSLIHGSTKGFTDFSKVPDRENMPRKPRIARKRASYESEVTE